MKIGRPPWAAWRYPSVGLQTQHGLAKQLDQQAIGPAHHGRQRPFVLDVSIAEPKCQIGFQHTKSGMLAQYLLMTYEFRVEIMEICLHGTRVVPACPRFSWDTCTRTWPSSFKRAASPIRRSHLRTLTPRATPFVAGWHESSMHMCLMLYLLAYHWYREQVRPGY